MVERAELIRAFIAVNFPEEVNIAASRISKQLASVPGRISWVKPEGVHLTLKFLGEINFQQSERVKQAINISVKDIQPFNLHFTELGVFPNKNRPRVIWWGLASDSFQHFKLYQNLEKELARCGFPREKRVFTPHLTLGRIRELAQPQQLEKRMQKVKLPSSIGILNINNIDLMQSTLTGSGAIYNSLHTFYF